MSKFEGTVEDIVFRNDQNGWTVAAIRLDGDKKRISAVGVMPFLSIDIGKGQTIVCHVIACHGVVCQQQSGITDLAGRLISIDD